MGVLVTFLGCAAFKFGKALFERNDAIKKSEQKRFDELEQLMYDREQSEQKRLDEREQLEYDRKQSEQKRLDEREQLELEYNRKQKALDREDAIKKSEQKRLDEREQLELEYNRKLQTAELSKAQNNPKVTTAFLACMREKEDLLAHTIPGMRAGLDDVIRYCEVRA